MGFFNFLGTLALGLAGQAISNAVNKPKAPPPPPPAPAPQIIKVVETQNSVNYNLLAQNARAAGFNPLTALRYGGAAGHIKAQTPILTSNPVFHTWEANRQHQIAKTAAENARRSQWGNMISGAFNSFAPYVSGEYQYKQRRQQTELALFQSEIRRNNHSNRGFSPLQMEAYAGQRFTKKPNTITGAPYVDLWEPGDVSVTNYSPDKHVDPMVADGEAFTKRVGEGEFLSPAWVNSWNIHIRDYKYDRERLKNLARDNARNIINGTGPVRADTSTYFK